jgi:opacity protein-like surface antigen
MLLKKLKLTAVFLLFTGLTALKAQEAIPASGGNATGNGGTVSFSVGQVVYTTNTGTNGSVAQGVQQPYEISVVTGLATANGIELQYSVYPNPTLDLLTLRMDVSISPSLQSMSYQLFDMNGKPLEYRKITDVVTSIKMSGLPMATYYLKISENNTVVKTFIIIKN